jgi:hypothetical protein
VPVEPRLIRLRSRCAPSRTLGLAAIPGFDVDVYLVLDDFGKIGRAYREVDETQADRATLIKDLICGQYNNPVRIVAFNTSEGWSRDVSEEIAREIREWADRKGEELSSGLREWIAWQIELGARSKRYAGAS